MTKLSNLAGAVAATTRIKRAKGRERGQASNKGAKVAKPAAAPREGNGAVKRETKQAIVLTLLRRPEGATIAEIQEVTGWLSHSVRGFLTAALKRRLKLEVVSAKDEKSGERRYRTAGEE